MCVDGAGTRYLAFSQGRSLGLGMMCEETGPLSSSRYSLHSFHRAQVTGQLSGILVCCEKPRPESLSVVTRLREGGKCHSVAYAPEVAEL